MRLIGLVDWLSVQNSSHRLGSCQQCIIGIGRIADNRHQMYINSKPELRIN